MGARVLYWVEAQSIHNVGCDSYQSYVFMSSSQWIHIMFLMDFQHVPQVPNVFLNMLPIAHHTLYHNFCPKLNKLYNIVGPKGGMSTNMFWKCRLLLWVLVVQTSKFHIFCSLLIKKKIQFFLGNNLGCISEVLDRTNNKWPKLVPMAGYWWFYNGPNSIRGMLFLVPLHTPYMFWV